MKFTPTAKTFRFLASVALLTGLLAVSARAATVIHQYDFQGPSGILQPGWTAMPSTQFFDASTPGFSPSNTYYSINSVAPSSTQDPTDVTIDYFISRGQTLSTPALQFRDIVPAFATSVTLTIYRSSPDDAYNAVGIITNLSYNGAAQFTIDSGGNFGAYQTPITYTLALDSLPTTGTLDFFFYDPIEQASNVRLNGVEAVYTVVPEPSVTLLFGVGALFAVRLARRSSRTSV